MPFLDPTYELLLIETVYNNTSFVVGALYHPPKPLYDTTTFIGYIERVLDYIAIQKPGYEIILAGDFNTLSDDKITNLGLISVPIGPTHRDNCLDRVYTSQFFYSNVKVVSSCINTMHKCVVASCDDQLFIKDKNKITRTYEIRKRTPSGNANLINFLSVYNWQSIYCFNRYESSIPCNVQVAFDCFYEVCNWALDKFYPLCKVKISSRDPPYITPHIKLLLKEKTRLLKRGAFEEANRVSERVGIEISKFNSKQLLTINYDGSNLKEMWSQIRNVIGKRNQINPYSNCSLSAEQFNDHYCSISTDSAYEPPPLKSTATSPRNLVSEEMVFRAISSLKPTAEGPDKLPFWFLKIASPYISAPIAFLFNLSYTTGVVPRQWKQVAITPIPKITQPQQCSDFRPISISSILSRMFEKCFTRLDIYPTLTDSSYYATHMRDQFAFRPFSSTTCALIAILDCLTKMLSKYPYVHFLTYDMSRAFDTIRHATLAEKLSATPLSDQTYNWIIDFLTNRTHCTKFKYETSSFANITASVIQGSGLGPLLFSINATDFIAVVDGNVIFKYADDFDMLIPSCNSALVETEIRNLEEWASKNNLKLNVNKTQEMIVHNKYSRNINFPNVIKNINRVDKIKVLGVTIDNKLSFSSHVEELLTQGSQRLYVLKTIKQHGLTGQRLYDVTRAILLNKITYAAPAWRGFCTTTDMDRLRNLLNKSIKWGLYSKLDPNLDSILDILDCGLLKTVATNDKHVLYPLLPTVKLTGHDLRKQTYNKEIVSRLEDKNFINRTYYINKCF